MIIKYENVILTSDNVSSWQCGVRLGINHMGCKTVIIRGKLVYFLFDLFHLA